MQKYEAIEKGIAEHDVKALREAIGSICYTCRDFSDGEFDAVVEYVEKSGIKIKDDNLVGSPILSNQKNTFTDEDFAKAVFALKKNFCDERILDVKKIGKTLYSVNAASNKSKIRNEQKPLMSSTTVKKKSSGTSPNLNSHQPEKKQSHTIQMVLGMMAIIIVFIVIIALLVKR